MTKEELVKGLKILGLAYNKGFLEEECVLYYDFLSKYSYETFKNAIKELIQNSKFLPKISEIIEACDKQKEEKKIKILELMKANGYFKTEYEYEKTLNFMSKGIIPSWIKEEMKKYINSKNQIINNPVGLIEG